MFIENETIRDIYNALEILSAKRLCERENEKRVVALLRRLKTAKKHLDEDHNRNIASIPLPDGWEERDLPARVSEERQKLYSALMRETQEIRDIPESLYLTEKDLPKIMKGEPGDENRTATAMIMAKLDFLFRMEMDGEEPDAVVDGKDGTIAEDAGE